MLNSSNYAREEGVLNVGVRINPEIDLKDPAVKVYYHQVKGARTVMPDGAEIVFWGGQFATKNKEIMEYMDKIADKPGTMIYTKSKAAIVSELQEAADDAARRASEAALLKDGKVNLKS